MRKSEKFIGGIVFFLMIIRLFFYYPILDKFILILTMLLSVVYFGLSFALLNNIRLRKIFKKESYNGISVLRVIGAIGTGIVLSMICIYCLFKFMRWPMANQGLIISLIILFFPILIVIIKLIITKNKFYLNFLIRLIIFALLAGILYLIPSEKILEWKNKGFPEYIQAEKQLMKDPTNKVLQQKVTKERKKKNSKN